MTRRAPGKKRAVMFSMLSCRHANPRATNRKPLRSKRRRGISGSGAMNARVAAIAAAPTGRLM